jgi:hypothetical protein
MVKHFFYIIIISNQSGRRGGGGGGGGGGGAAVGKGNMFLFAHNPRDINIYQIMGFIFHMTLN